MKRLAIFDLDGTFFRWQLYHELVFEFKEQGLFSEATAHDLDEALLAWQARRLKWHDYEMKVVNAFEPVIARISPSDLETVAKRVIDRSGHKVYDYTRQLRQDLAKQGYHTLAISGSPQEIAEAFAIGYQFDEAIGALYARENGLFTGEVSRRVPGRKHEILTEYLSSHPEFTLKNSVGVGDSSGDISMLEMVDRPIAFNPDTELLKAAKDNRWQIVIERKNIAFILEESNGTYLLADARQL